MEPGEAILGAILFISTALVFILRGPFGRAIAERIAGRRLDGGPGPDLPNVADRLAADLDDVRERVAELEERQDFSERMLAQQRDRGRLEAESHNG